MRHHSDSVWYGAVVGVAGAVWGLGLARLMAEVGLQSVFYGSYLAVGAVAMAASGSSLLVLRSIGRPSHGVVAWVPLALVAPYVVGLISQPLAGVVLLIGGGVLTLLLMLGNRHRWFPLVLVGLLASTLYLSTLLPHMGEADTLEFQVVVPQLGIAHPTGYPLYVLLTKLFTFLPLGTIAWRVSLASAVYATVAVVLLFDLLLRLTARILPSLLATLSFGFSAVFWSQAVVAEVYTLHILLVALILWLLMGWGKGSAIEGRLRRPLARRWQAVFLVTGLSLTNHLTTVLLLPALALVLLSDWSRIRGRDWVAAAALLLAGVSVYLFVPLRWPSLNNGEYMSLTRLFDYVTGAQFHDALRFDGWRDPVRWSIVFRLLRQPFGLVGLVLALLGLVALSRRPDRTLVLTGVTLVAFVIYGLNYYIPDVSVFMLPAHLVLAVWLGVGIASLGDNISRSRIAAGHGVGSSLLIALAVLPMSRIWVNLPQVDQSANAAADGWGRYVLRLPIKPDAVVLADVKKFAPLYYLHRIEGLRPDLDIVLLGTEALYREELTRRMDQGQTVYLARYLPHLEGMHLRSLGPLVEVSSVALTQVPAFQQPVDVRFGESVALLGFDVEGSAAKSPHVKRLTLYWQATSQVLGDYLVHIRLVDDAGEVQWYADQGRPVSGLYPTNAWLAGEVVPDFHEFQVPSYLFPGKYQLQVALFSPFSPDPIPSTGKAPWETLSTLRADVPQELPPLQNRVRLLFGSALWLTGHDAPLELATAASGAVILSWQGAHGVDDYGYRLTWEDRAGQRTTVISPRQTSGLKRASAWQSRVLLSGPSSSGPHTLFVSRMDNAGEPVPARCAWMAPVVSECPLADLEIVPPQEGLANFADTIRLVGADIGRTVAQPGETISGTLLWRALRETQDDYTEFVHLVGPDGRLHGQVDTWPLQGSYPTSQWARGGEVTDSFDVRLDHDAVPGHYRVEVGWYLLSTMERLQVIGEAGEPIGDSVVLGEFDVQD